MFWFSYEANEVFQLFWLFPFPLFTGCSVFLPMSSLASEAFSLTEVVWFGLCSSWITVDDIKYRGTEKHGNKERPREKRKFILKTKFTLWSRNDMTPSFRRRQQFKASKLSLRALYSVSQEKLLVKTPR